MGFIVHSIPGSPFGRAVLVALEEKGARYRFNPVVPGTLRSPEHRSRHPFGKIPVIEHDGFKLFETQAILRYIDRALPNSPLTPTGPQAAGRMDQMLNISDWYLYQGVGNVIGFQRIVVPLLLGRSPDEAAIRAAMPQAEAVFGELSRQLGDRPFFADNTLTLADILIASQLDFLAATPEWESLIADRSNLAEWLKRMNARPSMQATAWEQVSAMAQAAL
jgi:glutathione S-transferase